MQPEMFTEELLSDEDHASGTLLQSLAGGPLDVLIVLGSGLAETLDTYEGWGQPLNVVPLSDLPTVLAPVADGHRDELRTYAVGGLRVAVALGRTHLYEGHGPKPVTALGRAAKAAGAHTAILCNANGCLRDWELGDVMTISDHANLTGTSPFDGPIFLDTSLAWDPKLTEVLSKETQRTGNYALLRGPEYQTPLETRMLAGSGIDTVGMSTVMEALMLNALDVRVCGMSVVSDLSFAEAPTDPTQVVETAAKAHATILDGLNRVLEVLQDEGTLRSL